MILWPCIIMEIWEGRKLLCCSIDKMCFPKIIRRQQAMQSNTCFNIIHGESQYQQNKANMCIWSTMRHYLYCSLIFRNKQTKKSKHNTMNILNMRSANIPVFLCSVFEKLSQLERIFADFLDRSEQEAVYGNVDHLLEEATSLEEVLVPAIPH